MLRYHIKGYDASDRLVTQYVVVFDSDEDFYNNHYALTPDMSLKYKISGGERGKYDLKISPYPKGMPPVTLIPKNTA